MSSENGLAVFSTRLPKALADQIDQRAKIHRRTRNAEINLLLEMAIDLMVARDKKVLSDMHQSETTLTT